MKTRSRDDSITESSETSDTRQTSVVWPLHVVVWVLLPLGIAGALVLSATATIDKAARHGVPENIQPFAVAMLEVVSLAGTLLAVWAETRKLRREAMIAIIGASAVSFFAGISAYGWFGGVASVALVGLVHLASSAWLELRTRRTNVIITPMPETNPEEESKVDVETLSNAEEASGVEVSNEVERMTTLYKIFDTEDELLYVGVTYKIDHRLAHHRRKKIWWSEVSRVTTYNYRNRPQALAVEEHVIHSEHPKYNSHPGALSDNETLEAGYARQSRPLMTEVRVAAASDSQPTSVSDGDEDPPTDEFDLTPTKINLDKPTDHQVRSPTAAAASSSAQPSDEPAQENSGTNSDDESDNAVSQSNPLYDPDRVALARRLLSDNPSIGKQRLADELGVTKYRAAQFKEYVLENSEEMSIA